MITWLPVPPPADRKCCHPAYLFVFLLPSNGVSVFLCFFSFVFFFHSSVTSPSPRDRGVTSRDFRFALGIPEVLPPVVSKHGSRVEFYSLQVSFRSLPWRHRVHVTVEWRHVTSGLPRQTGSVATAGFLAPNPAFFSLFQVFFFSLIFSPFRDVRLITWFPVPPPADRKCCHPRFVTSSYSSTCRCID